MLPDRAARGATLTINCKGYYAAGMPTNLPQLAADHGIRPGPPERVGEAARRLGTTARMLRYAEDLGLVAPPRGAGGYRAYGEQDLLAVALALALQRRHGVTPAALAFGLRVLADPEIAGELRLLARLGRRQPAPGPATALQFETDKARRLLRLAS
jgi:MerR family transcriptional regulator, copper efflux regulator